MEEESREKKEEMEGIKKDSILKKKLKTNIQGILQAVWFQVNKYSDIICYTVMNGLISASVWTSVSFTDKNHHRYKNKVKIET